MGAIRKDRQAATADAWWSLHDTRTDDLRAMYRFIRHLGSAGKAAPQFVPPERKPPRPYQNFRVEN